MVLQIVLISGCSSGIGLSTAVLLAKDAEKRFKVYATMRNLARKGQLEEEGKKQLGETLIIKQMDVCSDESVTMAVKEVLNAEGKIDVLFNNAGIAMVGIPFEFIPIDMAKELFEVNYFGYMRLIQAVLPSMKARQSGLIINNSSHFGIVGVPFAETYCSSKFAVEGLTESLVPTLRHFNIRCCLLEPGTVLTPFSAKAQEWSRVSTPNADPKTLNLKSTFSAKIQKEIEGKSQSSEECAQFVKEIILDEKGNLRYQTNEKFGSKEVAAKLAEPSGNSSVDIITTRYFGEIKQER